MKYDVFISYRREGGYDTAKHLNDLLVRDGYKVSFDIDTLRSGDFDTQLYARIDQCKDFILIVDQHAFDRTLNQNINPKHDWLRCELAYALKSKKNVIPIFLSGISGFPKGLPLDIIEITKKNGPNYNRYHFNAFYDDLKKRFLHKNNRKKRPIYITGAIMSVLILSVIAYLFIPSKTITYYIEEDNNYPIKILSEYDKEEDIEEYEDMWPANNDIFFACSSTLDYQNQLLMVIDDLEEIDAAEIGISDEELETSLKLMSSYTIYEYYLRVKEGLVNATPQLYEDFDPIIYKGGTLEWIIYKFNHPETNKNIWRLSAKVSNTIYLNIIMIADKMNFLQEKRYVINTKRMLSTNDGKLFDYVSKEY